ncbi:pleiotropic regulatory protein RsmS [Oceanisphaera sediminis]|uniref:Pleiotropic regulatory protein RsmS n=1 Tax=Oceanisphaera sediminis TaxID=981381 RepID=A0ABP7DDL8_9GAMM
MTLADAPAEVQLAVDLIELLELNDVDPAVALAALAIVRTDCERKLTRADQPGQ